MKLKPCPFCGLDQTVGKPKVRVAFDTWTADCKPRSPFYIYCERCEAQGPIGDTESAAAAAWNRRALTVQRTPPKKKGGAK